MSMSVVDNCKNIKESYGYICVLCNKCKRFKEEKGAKKMVSIKNDVVEIRSESVEAYNKYMENLGKNIIYGYLEVLEKNVMIRPAKLKEMKEIADKYINGEYDENL